MKLGAVEAKFADLVAVTSQISKAEFTSIQSEEFVEETFAGSLPSFVAAFTRRNKLTPEEAEAIRKMIEEF